MAKKPVKIEDVDASIKRWKTRLKRAVNKLDELDRLKRRIEKAATKPKTFPAGVHAKIVDTTVMPKPEPLAVTIMREIAAPDPTIALTGVIDTGIPAFLQRKPLDPVAAGIKAEQDETKKKKAAGRIAKMKAKKSGETRKMPLTGKAALDAIRNG